MGFRSEELGFLLLHLLIDAFYGNYVNDTKWYYHLNFHIVILVLSKCLYNIHMILGELYSNFY